MSNPIPAADAVSEPVQTVETYARILAESNLESEPGITRILWFPHAEQVRLIEVLDDIPASDDGKLHPYYFSSDADFPYASALALIKPDEENRLEMPPGWESWDRGTVIFEAAGASAVHAG